MNYRIPILIIAILTLSSCETSEDTFLKFLEVRTNLTQASLELAGSGSQSIIAKIDNNNTIYGYGNGQRFSTTDLFNQIKTNRGFISYGYFEYENSVLYDINFDDDTNEIVILESFDQGVTFDTKVVIPDLWWADEDELYYYAIDETSGWLLAGSSSDEIEIFKIVGSNYESKGRVNGTYPASIYVRDNVGFILVDKHWSEDIKYIYKTTNQGETWARTGSFSLENGSGGNNASNPTIIRNYGNFVYAYSDRADQYRYDEGPGGILYISQDGGRRWSPSSNHNLSSFQFLNSNIGYAIKQDSFDDDIGTISSIYKTNNGGSTWNAISTPIYADRIYFRDENVGLAMSRSILQITNNGGKTWDLLVYPINQ